MGTTPNKLKAIVYFLLALFIVLSSTSGFLYRENKGYQNENQRLIILNDSILSENIELKNKLQQKGTAAMDNIEGRLKKKENK